MPPCHAHPTCPSVPLPTHDSQIGANVRVCVDEEDRADFYQRSRSSTIGTAGPRPKHATEGGLEDADRVAGQRWADGGGDRGGRGQEPAHGPPVAPPLCGEGG